MDPKLNPIIELARGLAAWMVLTAHYSKLVISGPSLLSFMWSGVDLFFVISGFVFAPLLLSGGFALGPFAIRRLFRIYPLYLFSLLLYALMTPGDPSKPLYFVKHLLFLGTTESAREAFFFNPAYWSLPVEVEYYLALPLLAWLLRGRILWVVLLLVLFLGLRLVIVSGATSFSAPDPNLLTIFRFHLPGILIEFLVGVLLYWAYRRCNATGGGRWPTAALAAGVALWLVLALFFAYRGDPGINASLLLRSYFSFLAALSYGLILFWMLMRVRCRGPLCMRIALTLGALSYGVYLLHILVLRLYEGSELDLPGPYAYLLCSAAVVALAGIAHVLIEQPMRDYGRALAARARTPSGSEVVESRRLSDLGAGGRKLDKG
ncbi:acyltransferase family protein [Imhoffiella purpurea]|uniref:Acyltransferase 3 n=1 Tax=Imhoffiella purpurea TaxID=1249627 RepID=W9VZG7_9GAMM|nr:acyltransferase [Imhoffiella purpurea]EXJ15775.1 Acyltransferase 3 [Imhoffiella purpurea]